MTFLYKDFETAAVFRKPKFLDRIFGGNANQPTVKMQSREGLSREDRFMLRHATLMQQVFDFLARTGLDPIPDYYELASHYLTCSSSTQRMMVESRMLEHSGNEPNDACELLDKIRTAISERELRQMVEDARHD